MHLVVVDLLDLLLNEIVLLVTQKQLCQFLVTYLILSWKLILGWSLSSGLVL